MAANVDFNRRGRLAGIGGNRVRSDGSPQSGAPQRDDLAGLGGRSRPVELKRSVPHDVLNDGEPRP